LPKYLEVTIIYRTFAAVSLLAACLHCLREMRWGFLIICALVLVSRQRYYLLILVTKFLKWNSN